MDRIFIFAFRSNSLKYKRIWNISMGEWIAKITKKRKQNTLFYEKFKQGRLKYNSSKDMY